SSAWQRTQRRTAAGLLTNGSSPGHTVAGSSRSSSAGTALPAAWRGRSRGGRARCPHTPDRLPLRRRIPTLRRHASTAGKCTHTRACTVLLSGSPAFVDLTGPDQDLAFAVGQAGLSITRHLLQHGVELGFEVLVHFPRGGR